MRVTTTVEALEAELDKLPEDLQASSLAMTAMRMAELLDGEGSPTSKTMAAGRMLDIVNRLRDLSPQKTTKGPLDEITAQREKRRANAAG